MSPEAPKPSIWWAVGAQDAGWKLGWRDAIDVGNGAGRAIEIYCYAALPVDFLQDERHQLYWTNDLVQMTRSFLREAARAGVQLQDPGERISRGGFVTDRRPSNFGGPTCGKAARSG
jgi:hypothetical protein